MRGAVAWFKEQWGEQVMRLMMIINYITTFQCHRLLKLWLGVTNGAGMHFHAGAWEREGSPMIECLALGIITPYFPNRL